MRELLILFKFFILKDKVAGESGGTAFFSGFRVRLMVHCMGRDRSGIAEVVGMVAKKTKVARLVWRPGYRTYAAGGGSRTSPGAVAS